MAQGLFQNLSILGLTDKKDPAELSTLTLQMEALRETTLVQNKLANVSFVFRSHSKASLQPHRQKHITLQLTTGKLHSKTDLLQYCKSIEKKQNMQNEICDFCIKALNFLLKT